MRTLRTTLLLTALSGTVLLTGCISAGVYDRDRDGNPYQRDDAREVQGTVERVDPVNRRIVVAEGEATGGRDERRDPDERGDPNGARDDRGGREIALYYDDATAVEHEGRSYRPQDLEPGDRIRAEVEATREGLMAQQIEVLADVNGGRAPEPAPEASGDERDRRDEQRDPERDDRRNAAPLRGTVRYVDTRAHTLQIETPASDGRPGLVEVLYDGETDVEVQGHRDRPENLERGDQVEIAVRQHGGRLLAQQIVVIDEGRTGNP
jgi:cold shock CspA family protein